MCVADANEKKSVRDAGGRIRHKLGAGAHVHKLFPGTTHAPHAFCEFLLCAIKYKLSDGTAMYDVDAE